MNFGYARVSSREQKLDRQLESLAGVSLDEVFQEKISGKDNNRPELERMLTKLREGDVVFIKSMDRIARSFKGFMEIWERIEKCGASLKVMDMGLTLDRSPMTQFLVTVMAAVSELERGMIRQRQKEGVAIAKEQGLYTGRRPDLKKHLAFMELRDAGTTVNRAAELAGIGRAQAFRIMKEYDSADDVRRLINEQAKDKRGGNLPFLFYWYH
ncbi:transposon resolvase [Salmonella enterica subsp. enterica serovar Paratyphi B str. SARA62]|nr:recombinase family protein [Salmonella enterica]ESE71682.1 transposon resolvase [Salmonella enterica subsp. enterica serovar Paratyphi B str. SARA62]